MRSDKIYKIWFIKLSRFRFGCDDGGNVCRFGRALVGKVLAW